MRTHIKHHGFASMQLAGICEGRRERLWWVQHACWLCVPSAIDELYGAWKHFLAQDRLQGYAMLSRAKNPASAKDILKVFKANGVVALPDAEDYSSPEVIDTCKKFEEFLVDLLRCTPRPTVPVLQAGCVMAWHGVTKDGCRCFRERLVRADPRHQAKS